VIDDNDPDWSPPVENSGALDVSAAGSGKPGAAGVSRPDHGGLDESEIRHGSWRCVEEPEDDSDGFSTPGWHAENIFSGERRLINHSRFGFHMTAARFRWLAEHNFPASPGKGPWTDAAIDDAMEDGA
jgi:hypothetical protein